MNSGSELFEQVFAEEVETNGDLHLAEIEDVDGVEDYDDDIYANEGWYNYHSVTFKYKGKQYNFEYKKHTSDNVCDTEYDYDSFSEIELEDNDVTVNAKIKEMTVRQLLVNLSNDLLEDGDTGVHLDMTIEEYLNNLFD
jgi:hypothetical protein